MANRTSAEWRQYIYDKATKVSDKYKNHGLLWFVRKLIKIIKSVKL